MKKQMMVLAVPAALALVLGLGGCGDGGNSSTSSTIGVNPQTISGSIAVDGSSTVAPITSAIAEEFGKEFSNARPTVGTSGTGGGVKKFINGEIDIANASRPLEEDEIRQLSEKGIEFIEIPVAFDGLSVVVNPKNDFVDDISVEELKRIWEPGSKVRYWSDVRPGFPQKEMQLYGAGTDSGTFDYFTKAIVGKEKASRTNYQPSEDDNQLVQGVAGDQYALGYFGYAYFHENKDKLKLLKINGVAPSPETINNGTYQPLSRPLLIYINKKSLEEKPQVKAFVDYYLQHVAELAPEVGYVPLHEEDYEAVRNRVASMTTGSVFRGAEVGVKISDILGRQRP